MLWQKIEIQSPEKNLSAITITLQEHSQTNLVNSDALLQDTNKTYNLYFYIYWDEVIQTKLIQNLLNHEPTDSQRFCSLGFQPCRPLMSREGGRTE